MERSKANKKKFQMRSPFKGSIAEFMAMGKALGSSKINPSTAVDPSKYYTPPNKKVVEKPESASKRLKNIKATLELGRMDTQEKLDKKREKMGDEAFFNEVTGTTTYKKNPDDITEDYKN